MVNIDGRDRLVMYERGRLNWFEPESATEHPLVAVTSNTLPPKGEIPHVDVTRDLNGDGRDDLVVPDSDGFWVFIQMDNGAFADPVKIGPPIEMSRIYAADGYRYDPWSQGRVHEMDYNRDGRSDLVFWNEDHFEVHLQDERGLFAPVAKTFTTDVVFDSDDPASLAAPQEVRRRRRDHQLTGATTGRVLHSLTDMNGDGVADPRGFLAGDQEHVERPLRLRGAFRRANIRWRHHVRAGRRYRDPVGRPPVRVGAPRLRPRRPGRHDVRHHEVRHLQDYRHD